MVTVRAFNPYLYTRGGGEYYFLQACLALAESHTVEVVSPDRAPLTSQALRSVAETFGLDASSLGTIGWSRGLLGRRSLRSTLGRADLALTVSNTYPITAEAPHANILQFPWDVARWRAGRRARAKRALQACRVVITYSEYVRAWVERCLDYRAEVLYPPVFPVRPGAKGPIILSVGRLMAAGNKKHDVMIDAFRRLERAGISGWTLVLVGSTGSGDRSYVESLRERARGSRVEILPDLDRAALESMYGKASVYWHAAGYGEDELAHPERFEHFGIAVVEAMSAGAVPVVPNGGGLPEIVEPEVSGYLWKTVEGLVESTARLIDDGERRGSMADAAIIRAGQFHPSLFGANLRERFSRHGLL
jgi:glycosyltransferase involved in cell wall biosynthesis